MIIDSHAHIGTSEKLSMRYMTFESCYYLMRASGIDKAVAIPNLSSEIKSSMLNEKMLAKYHRSEVREYFYPMLVIDPRDMNSLEQIEEYNDIIYGVKYHPSISEMIITKKNMRPFLELIGKYNLPALIHCGRHWRSHISYLIDVAVEFKSITFIAAHMGGNATDLVTHAIDLIKASKAENIYLDTSASKLPWLIEKAVTVLGADKILFGSDEPYADVRIAKYCVELCDINDENKKLIFYKNLERILGVEDV